MGKQMDKKEQKQDSTPGESVTTACLTYAFFLSPSFRCGPRPPLSSAVGFRWEMFHVRLVRGDFWCFRTTFYFIKDSVSGRKRVQRPFLSLFI